MSARENEQKKLISGRSEFARRSNYRQWIENLKTIAIDHVKHIGIRSRHRIPNRVGTIGGLFQDHSTPLIPFFFPYAFKVGRTRTKRVETLIESGRGFCDLL